MKMHAENLEIALNTAIVARSAEEKELHGEQFESALVAGWKAIAAALQRGEKIEVQ